ncbi:tyrosine-type recombinase/integrase [Novosphingobium mathurense]|uniref:Site-specific recombinase XerD n=1 Tax=Novosphingobium mathurense TaxID=428990 RepID=A0A1U6IRK0_9SPHN|nr:tyrosine-type recombinase/integrase [Novosphingobium mathurense]SLK10620.1 Site-specific recombinase XerD [Novosphingobium mathurense]
MLVEPGNPFPSSVELVLKAHAPLIDTRRASVIALEAAVSAMAPATRAAITADLKCFLAWCAQQRPAVQAVPASPETLVHYLRWLSAGSQVRAPAKPATLARRIASIARIHRVLGFGESEPLPTQAGMVRDTLKGIRRQRPEKQRQAAPLRFGQSMADGQAAPDGVTVQALLATCGRGIQDLRDAALISLAYDAGLRVSELVACQVADLTRVGDGSGRLHIARSKTDQTGEGTLAWISPDTMARLLAWQAAAGILEGPVFRRIHVLTGRPDAAGQQTVRNYVGDRPLTRQGVVAILRRRAIAAIELGHVQLEPGRKEDVIRSLSAHSFRVGLTQDLFAAGEDGAGIALALRWSSPGTALHYARELAVGSNAVARVLGKMRAADLEPG